MSATLVLNSNYKPVKTISWVKAIGMVQRGAAEIVENYKKECVYTNEFELSDYDIENYGLLSRFFDEELLALDRVRIKLFKPAVIRVFSPRFGRQKVQFSRVNIYLRDDHKCQYEGCRTTAAMKRGVGTTRLHIESLTFDHILPKSQGGKTTWLNIVTCCKDCNSRKDSRTPEQARMVLIRQPYQPKQVPIVRARVQTPEEWKNFLFWNVELDE